MPVLIGVLGILGGATLTYGAINDIPFCVVVGFILIFITIIVGAIQVDIDNDR